MKLDPFHAALAFGGLLAAAMVTHTPRVPTAWIPARAPIESVDPAERFLASVSSGRVELVHTLTGERESVPLTDETYPTVKSGRFVISSTAIRIGDETYSGASLPSGVTAEFTPVEFLDEAAGVSVAAPIDLDGSSNFSFTLPPGSYRIRTAGTRFRGPSGAAESGLREGTVQRNRLTVLSGS